MVNKATYIPLHPFHKGGSVESVALSFSRY
nr:MAG TPA: hypothetical protein [Caudoviricetes sp.]